MRRIILAGLVAVVAVLLIAPAAYAAPSMTVSDVVSPRGPRQYRRADDLERALGRTSAPGTRRTARRPRASPTARASEARRRSPTTTGGSGRTRRIALRSTGPPDDQYVAVSTRDRDLRAREEDLPRTPPLPGGVLRGEVGVVGVPARRLPGLPLLGRQADDRLPTQQSQRLRVLALPSQALGQRARDVEPLRPQPVDDRRSRPALHALAESVVLTETVSPGTMITVA